MSIRPYSLMDRISDSGSDGGSSILPGGTTKLTTNHETNSYGGHSSAGCSVA